MTYHESFWVAVAAAAPVIALANTVTITDLTSAYFSFDPASFRSRRSHTFSRLGYLAYVSCSAVNLCVLGLVLYIGLKSLYEGVDEIPPASVSFFVTIGLLYVLLMVIGNIQVRYVLRNVEKRAKERAKENETRAEARP